MQQTEVEDLYGKLMKMTDMSCKEYLDNQENTQHVEEYFDRARKKVKKDNAEQVNALAKNGNGLVENYLSVDNNDQKSKMKAQIIEESADLNKNAETDDLACNDEVFIALVLLC